METKLHTMKDPEYWIKQMHPLEVKDGIRYFEKKSLDTASLNAVAALDAEIRVLRSRIENNIGMVRITKKSIEKLQVILDRIKEKVTCGT